VAEGDGTTTDSGATSFEEFQAAEGGVDFSGLAGAFVDYKVPARAFNGFIRNVTAA
jgi:hypothetical protein